MNVNANIQNLIKFIFLIKLIILTLIKINKNGTTNKPGFGFYNSI